MISSHPNCPRPDELWKLLRSPVVLLSHKNVDVDGAACICAFAREIEKRGMKYQVLLPEGPSSAASKLFENTRIQISKDEPKGNSTLILDALSPDQILPYQLQNLPRPIAVIDHHYSNLDFKVDYYFVESRPSCAELLLDFLEPDKFSANILLAGIVTDTSHFRYADQQTFKTAVHLLDFQASVESALNLINIGDDISERIARIKAARKLNLERVGGLLMVFTEAGSFESSVASSILGLGADIAVVASGKKNFTRVSVRTREVGLHVGKLLEKLANEIGGSGGGHSRAGVLEANKEVSYLLNRVVGSLQEALNELGNSPSDAGQDKQRPFSSKEHPQNNPRSAGKVK